MNRQPQYDFANATVAKFLVTVLFCNFFFFFFYLWQNETDSRVDSREFLVTFLFLFFLLLLYSFLLYSHLRYLLTDWWPKFSKLNGCIISRVYEIALFFFVWFFLLYYTLTLRGIVLKSDKKLYTISVWFTRPNNCKFLVTVLFSFFLFLSLTKWDRLQSRQSKISRHYFVFFSFFFFFLSYYTLISGSAKMIRTL